MICIKIILKWLKIVSNVFKLMYFQWDAFIWIRALWMVGKKIKDETVLIVHFKSKFRGLKLLCD